MQKTKTPCIGICSTTSLGDLVCRGCKRYGFEVINWNGYDAEAKQAVLSRIEKFTVQILSARFQVLSETALKRGLEQYSIPFNPALSPYCWLHNLLKKRRGQITGQVASIDAFAMQELRNHQRTFARNCFHNGNE